MSRTINSTVRVKGKSYTVFCRELPLKEARERYSVFDSSGVLADAKCGSWFLGKVGDTVELLNSADVDHNDLEDNPDSYNEAKLGAELGVNTSKISQEGEAEGNFNNAIEMLIKELEDVSESDFQSLPEQLQDDPEMKKAFDLNGDGNLEKDATEKLNNK